MSGIPAGQDVESVELVAHDKFEVSVPASRSTRCPTLFDTPTLSICSKP